MESPRDAGLDAVGDSAAIGRLIPSRYRDQPEAHRIQILVRSAGREHAFRVGAEYVYPASAIKTFLSVAALRKAREVGGDGPIGRSGVGRAIVALQVVSDNKAFTSLYDFVGHRELNESLWGLGFDTLRVHHRMGGTREAGLMTPRTRLTGPSGPMAVAARTSTLALPPTPAKRLHVGRKHISPTSARLIEAPMSFAEKNFVSLRDLQRLQIALVTGKPDLGLREQDRLWLLDTMTDKAPDEARHKPLLPGVLRVLHGKRVRYVSKSGRAYGFHIANAFIEDRETGNNLFVTASIYVNPNGVVNDDLYDYAGATAPFMADLGEALARTFLLHSEGM